MFIPRAKQSAPGNTSVENPLARTILFLSLSIFTGAFQMHDAVAHSGVIPKHSWKELHDQKSILPRNGAFYYQFPLENGSVAHLVVAYIKGGKWNLVPVLLEKTMPTSRAAAEQSASAAVNGGFFNLSNGLSASYITQGGKILADPHDNQALATNPKLQSFLAQIYNRSEIRFLRNSNAASSCIEIQIAQHNDKLPEGMSLESSLQAGPRLLPSITAEEEAFVRKQADGSIVDSIGCRKPAARTAFGITPDGYALLLSVSGKGQDKESSGITLGQLADLMRRLGCRQAINLDGGSSTSMYVRLADSNSSPGQIVCAKEPETLVKTILLLVPQ